MPTLLTISPTERFPKNGVANRVASEDRVAHDWYRFVLSFPPHLVRKYVDRFGLSEKSTVLDPFCGTGTTLVECKRVGVPSVGVEAHPMSHFATATKVCWNANSDSLLLIAGEIQDRALNLLRKEGLPDEPTGKNALVSTISNLHFGPEVGVSKPKADSAVILPWLSQVAAMAKDLRQLRPEIQRIAAAIESRRIELGKTSGFERMYARLTKLYFGGMARHFAELRKVLKPGARLAYVVGDQASYLRVMIRTGQLIAEIAESLGYEVEEIDLFRTRLSTVTREQLREEVVVLKWPGKNSLVQA